MVYNIIGLCECENSEKMGQHEGLLRRYVMAEKASVIPVPMSPKNRTSDPDTPRLNVRPKSLTTPTDKRTSIKVPSPTVPKEPRILAHHEPIYATPMKNGVSKDPDSPGTLSIASDVSSCYAPSEPCTPKMDRSAALNGKQTLGEIIAQIESRSKALLSQHSFVNGEGLSDLQYLAHQSRYSSDIGIKRRLIAKLVEHGLLEVFLKVFASVRKVNYFGGEDEDGQTTDAMRNLRTVVVCVWNSTDKSPQLCDQCSKQGLIPLLLQELDDPRLAITELKDSNRAYLVKGYLGILNNVIRFHERSREMFRENSAVKLLQNFIKCSALPVKTKAIMLLSYVINETENDIINATDKNLVFMVKMLQAALESENHYSKKYGYWAVEVAAGLNRLASCDFNQERLLHKGVLSLYTSLIDRKCTEEEQLVASLGLWTLAFCDACRLALREDKNCIRALENLFRSSQREEIRRASRGCVYLVEGRLPPVRPLPLQKHSPDGAVVISFQWSSRSIVGKIKERLRSAGYVVSTYTDSSGGPSIDSMLQHIESASIVLVAMSHKYKESPHCRTECEIAIRLGLDLIPIRAQRRYSPEGWLSRLLSDKMCFDFTQDGNFDSMFTNLTREIANRGHLNPAELETPGSRAVSTGSLCQAQVQVHRALSGGPSGLDLMTPESRGRPFRALGWSSADVAGWLRQNNLSHVTEKFKLIDGELLSELRKMQQSAPESFYSALRNDMNFDLITCLKFTNALDYL
ncbi:hypothetical protein CAPTEDRAFT_226936 [Capitella teleta]|uniref:TIR domain-containing protein n=1 Tax=Capitella teleta TaxID=283909 RepID=R7U1Y7_CAPTE|nr:hypothetical protein CAPTEDRAFT_226936 [Capitella teleta]|eukprot:ELT99867.1 hypothetical protein CAPTEDRAFT_226936 [Capitella teleta]